ADVAVADLHEAERVAAASHRLHGTGLSERRPFQHSARQRPHRAGTHPCHAFQEIPSIELFFVVIPSHAFLLQRRRTLPHTISPPRCPATATRAPAPSNAIRYIRTCVDSLPPLDVASAAVTANSALVVPSHLCHSRIAVVPISGADASSQPAATATSADSAPARALARPMSRQRRRPVIVATASAATATMRRAIGKGISSGCNRPISAICHARPRLAGRYSPE